MRPNSVRMPVATTSARAVPETTVVPASSPLRQCRISGSVARLGVARQCVRLAGDRRDVDRQLERLDDATVGRDAVAGLQEDHIARHECLGRYAGRDTVAQCHHFLRQQLLQGEERLLGPILLPEREHPVHGDDRDDGERQCAHPMARLAQVGDEGQRRRDPEDDGKEVRELTEKLRRDRHAGEALDGFGPNSSKRRAASADVSPAGLVLRLSNAASHRQLMDIHRVACCKSDARTLVPGRTENGA